MLPQIGGRRPFSCRMHYGAPDRLRKLGFDEHLFGIQIVFTGLIDDPKLTELPRLGIRNGNVDLSALQRDFVARVVQANDKS